MLRCESYDSKPIVHGRHSNTSAMPRPVLRISNLNQRSENERSNHTEFLWAYRYANLAARLSRGRFKQARWAKPWLWGFATQEGLSTLSTIKQEGPGLTSILRPQVPGQEYQDHSDSYVPGDCPQHKQRPHKDQDGVAAGQKRFPVPPAPTDVQQVQGR